MTEIELYNKLQNVEGRLKMMNPICNNSVGLPKGTIKKLIGRELSFTDEPVELV